MTHFQRGYTEASEDTICGPVLMSPSCYATFKYHMIDVLGLKLGPQMLHRGIFTNTAVTTIKLMIFSHMKTVI